MNGADFEFGALGRTGGQARHLSHPAHVHPRNPWEATTPSRPGTRRVRLSGVGGRSATGGRPGRAHRTCPRRGSTRLRDRCADVRPSPGCGPGARELSTELALLGDRGRCPSRGGGAVTGKRDAVAITLDPLDSRTASDRRPTQQACTRHCRPSPSRCRRARRRAARPQLSVAKLSSRQGGCRISCEARAA